MGDFKRLAASDVGLRAPRGCTNVCGLILFVLMWGLMGYVAFVGYHMGDIRRLIYGTDYLGNICGKGDADVYINGAKVTDWSSRSQLWYPVTFDFATNQFQLTEARKLGVCVAQCPGQGALVERYLPPNTTVTLSDFYYSLFQSTAKFNRCVPDLSTFLCGGNNTCNSLKDTVTATIGDVYDGLAQGFNSLQAGWWILLVCSVIAIVVCFAWMFILRRLVKPMVVVTMIILVVVLAVGGYLLYYISGKSSTDEANKRYYLGGAIAMWIVDFILICIMLFVRKDVMIACDIIEEASKIPTSMPTMMLVPLVSTLMLLPFAFFFLFTSASIYTAASTLNVTAVAPQFNGGGNNTVAGYVSLDTKEYKVENWRVYAEVYNLLIFLWSVGFVNAIGYMTLAFCAVFWYWSNPGDDKKPEAGACTGFGLTVKNHLGNLAIGSLIVAIIQVLRVMLTLMEKKLEAYAGKSDAVKCCLYCAECLLACFNRIVKFINKNSYIMTAMTGEGFLDAAKHALDLLMANVLSVAAISIIGEWVCMFGKVLITSVVLVICYFMAGGSTGDKNVILLMVVVGLTTYFITCVFINVFHVCIDTVLLCYCYDLREHDGQSKPYYFPSDLAKHVDRARERMAAKQKSEAVNQMDAPLKK